LYFVLDLSNSIYCDYIYLTRLLGSTTLHKLFNNIKSGVAGRELQFIIAEKEFGIRILNKAFAISQDPLLYHLVVVDKEKWLWNKLKYDL
jgi:hypothetical protein